MRTRLQPVDVGETSEDAVSRETLAQSTFTSLLTVSLKALSQRAIVALASLVDLALIASAFVLWLNVIQQPNILQLVGIGMYAAFILVAIWARSR
jgi:hypothetical protein